MVKNRYKLDYEEKRCASCGYRLKEVGLEEYWCARCAGVKQ